MPENDKRDAITDDEFADPSVAEMNLWYDDDKNTYPIGVVSVNGLTFDREGAQELYNQLHEVLHGDGNMGGR